MLTMAPPSPPWSDDMRRTASPAQRNGPTTLTAVIRRIRSGGIWSTRSCRSAVPAVFTRAPKRPRPSAARNRAATSSGDAMSGGTAPLTGFYRNGCCHTGPDDLGSHTICAVVTAEFLAHQRRIGNDLMTPMPQYHFPGLVPGDRWCVTAINWLRAHRDGVAAPVVLASTHERALEIVPLEALQEHAVDVPADPSALT